MLKKLLVAAVLASSVSAIANEGAGWGSEDVIAAGGGTTIVGGCANAVIVGSGENYSVVCTEPTAYAPTKPAGCEATQSVLGFVGGKLTVIGYTCPDYNDFNGGN